MPEQKDVWILVTDKNHDWASAVTDKTLEEVKTLYAESLKTGYVCTIKTTAAKVTAETNRQFFEQTANMSL